MLEKLEEIYTRPENDEQLVMYRTDILHLLEYIKNLEFRLEYMQNPRSSVRTTPRDIAVTQ